MHRTYTNEDITLFWNSEKCRHAKMCVTGCPKVFEFGRRPWVILENGENPEIWKAVRKCPSGALTAVYNHGVWISYDKEGCRSVATAGDREIGVCEYREEEGEFQIFRTKVDPDYENKGIGRRLVYRVLEEAERQKKRVSATCPYAAGILQE